MQISCLCTDLEHGSILIFRNVIGLVKWSSSIFLKHIFILHLICNPRQKLGWKLNFCFGTGNNGQVFLFLSMLKLLFKKCITMLYLDHYFYVSQKLLITFKTCYILNTRIMKLLYLLYWVQNVIGERYVLKEVRMSFEKQKYMFLTKRLKNIQLNLWVIVYRP